MGNPQLIVATTNYDRATEAALAANGHEIDTGFRAEHERTPTLQPEGLVENAGLRTPVLHLHGAVGWYERQGTVEDHYADQAYNPSLGTPVVLYPDPDKDPTSDATVSQIWTEFRHALQDSDVVLVIGHSLHDQALVNELNQAALEKPVGITFFRDEESERVSSLVPKAAPIQMDFGPTTDTNRKELRSLLK